MQKSGKPPAAAPKKKGRPPSLAETKQVAVRLPVDWIERFRKTEGGVTKAVVARLLRSLVASDHADLKLLNLAGAIEQLAIRVRRHYGAEWHEDQNAHRVFVEAVKRLVSDLPEPAACTTEAKHAPKLVGEVIYKDYVASVREDERTLTTAGPPFTRMRPSIKTLMGDDNG
jgi:hypothetical protein